MYRIAVIGAKGGTGKSTIAYGLSKVLSKDFSVVLLDLSTSRTISNVMGIRGSLSVGHDFMANDGNLKVISFHLPFVQLNETLSLENVYNEIINETEFLVIDYGVHLYDRVALYELELFYRHHTDPTHIIAVSLPHDFIIKSTEKTIYFYNSIIRKIKQMELGILDFFTINMLRQEEAYREIRVSVNPVYGIVKIPFHRDLSFNGFWSADVPTQIFDMALRLAQAFKGERTI